MTDQPAGFDRLSKKWQEHVSNLERTVAEQEKHIQVLSEGPADSNVFIRDFVHPDRPLGRDVGVDFQLGEDTSDWAHRVSVRIQVSPYHRTRLYVSGGNVLAILPQSSNAFFVEVED